MATLTAVQALKIAERLHAKLMRRRVEIRRYEDYFNGKHRLEFASDEWAEFNASRYAGFSDNWCEVVARSAAERVNLTGIRVGEDADVQSPVERDLWRHWVANNGEANAAMGYLSGAVSKRHFVTVWGDSDDEPTLSWDHAAQTIVESDEFGRGRFALRSWVTDDTENVTLYTADELWKWSRPYTEYDAELPVWQIRLPEMTGDDTWPIPNPLGILPVVEVPNRPVLGKGPLSDIEGTIPMQDAINLMWAYLFSAGDSASMPARVVLGQEAPRMPVLDDQGQPTGETRPVTKEQLTNGRMLWVEGENAKIAQWDAARLDVFTGAMHVMVKHLISRTRTPAHYIMGELGNVNGDTLTAAEIPLAYKVREQIKHSQHPMREVFRRIALVKGDDGLAKACRTARLQWANPETATDAQQSDAALKDSQIGWSFASILERRYGLSQDEISDELKRRDSEAADPYLVAKGLTTNDSPDTPDDGGEVPARTDA